MHSLGLFCVASVCVCVAGSRYKGETALVSCVFELISVRDGTGLAVSICILAMELVFAWGCFQNASAQTE